MRHASRGPGLGARAAGPHPRRQARFPGDAGQRPALPGGSCQASVHPGPRPVDAQGTRRGGGARRERGPLARIRAARRGPPGMRASGPRSQGARARRASTPGLGARTRREQGAMLGLAGSAGRRPASAPPGAVPRGCGPAARAPRGLVPCERPPRASVRGRAGNKARCWGSPGARAAGPHPRRQARSPGDAGQRPALPGARSLRASTPGLGARTRREQGAVLGLAGSAGRRPASAPPGAVPRGCGGQRPALPGEPRLASVHPGHRCADAQGTRRDVGARRERGPPARIRAARRGPPGMRASGPRSQGLVPCERPPRASVRGRAGNKARCWGSPGARAAGPHPRRQARFPGDAAASGPRSQGSRAWRASTPGIGARTRREQGAAVGLAGSAGRRPASAPPGAVPRGCGPAARAPRGSCQASVHPGLGARTRREQGAMLGLAGSAGRRPASAPPGAVPRGCGGQRPALPGEPRLASVHPGPRCADAQGTRHGGGARRERGPPARIRAARRGSPGMRASGPRSQGARSLRASTPGLGARTRREQGAVLGLAGSAGRRPASAPPGAVPRGCGGQRPALPGEPRLASVHPGHRCADAQGTRRDVGARRERGPPARIRAARRGPPGMRASGPRSQGLVPCERPPRASVRGRAGNKARRWGSPGARAAGPHPRRQARFPGDAAASGPRSQGSRAWRASTPGIGARTRREQGAAVGLAGSAGRRPASAPPGAVLVLDGSAGSPHRTVRRNQPNSPATSSRSSTSSASVISSLARLKSSTLRPSTMRQSPAAQVTG